MNPNTPPPGAGSLAPRIAVLIPCYNEACSIEEVVKDFRSALAAAEIYVYDNNSTDGTAERAMAAGATVCREARQGKGNVVRRMFGDIEADAYILVDGDGTYDAADAPSMLDLLFRERLDMVVGRRMEAGDAAYRPGHRFGNRLLTGMVARLFGKQFHDMLSGYRVFSRRFVKSFAISAPGFEIETEITVHALALRVPIREVDTAYRPRAEGSASKLHTYRDGFRILRLIFDLLRDGRPLLFFSSVAFALAIISAALGYPVVVEYLETGLVPRFPTAILATGLAILAALSITCGFILDIVTRSRLASATLAYLAIPRWGAVTAVQERATSR